MQTRGALRHSTPFLVLLALTFVIPMGQVMAQPTDALRAHRSHVLAAMEAHMTALGDIVDGKVALTHHATDHAVAIVGTSRGLLELFPEKTAGLPQKNGEVASAAAPPPATPFQTAAIKFNEQAARLVQMTMSSTRDAVGRQYVVLKDAYTALRKLTD